MKFELRHCKKGCNCMTNHFIGGNGDIICGKCGQVTRGSEMPDFIKQFMGGKVKKVSKD